MTDETEVIDATHSCSDSSMASYAQRSQAYHDTEVTQSDRTVKFSNTATFSDSSTGLERRVHIGICVDGDITWLPWAVYTSPVTNVVHRPEVEITVPDDGEPSHLYQITERCRVERRSGDTWVHFRSFISGDFVATVKESSPTE